MKLSVLITAILMLAVLATGCVQENKDDRSYSVSDNGVLTLRCGTPSVSESPLAEHGTVSVRRIVFNDSHGPVYALLASPKDPVAGFVVAPGAGVTKDVCTDRARMYAEHGFAFLVLDIRGNGGETRGYPLNIEEDYRRFSEGEWPEYYLSACDVMNAGDYLAARYSIPVYAVGESNGGRYAAIAAASDPVFSGYIGVSTSGFREAGLQYTGDARLFLLSIDPDTYAGRISPRSSWIFHAPADPVIPFGDGMELYNRTATPHAFFSFNGTHGPNDEVDRIIIGECAQIYGTPG